jgi:hypothetical protein
LCGIYERAVALGEAPVVVDADDLENDPAGTINAYCHALDLPFMPEALTWESEQKPEWDIWKDWHADAARSTGIRKNVETFDVTIENSELLRSYYDNQLAYYQTIRADRIRPMQPM